MLLNGGVLNDQPLLRQDTVKMMIVDQLAGVDIPHEDYIHLADRVGFGFTILPDVADVHEQLRDAYAWFGFWSTSFRISLRGDWILVTMTQRAWGEPETPLWFVEYERIAAEAIIDGT